MAPSRQRPKVAAGEPGFITPKNEFKARSELELSHIRLGRAQTALNEP